MVAGIALATAPAEAHYNGTGQQSANMPVYPYNYNSTWQTPMNQALSNWNATASPAYIHKYSGSGSRIYAASYSDTWYGHYTRCGDACFYIKLNARTISRDANNFSNYVTSVLVHELGHGLNLAHNSVTSIMNSSRNRDTMTKPQSHDVSDVNAYY